MKTALVLSAGGMYSAWQAGVWRNLSRRWTPDLVVGTSAGALNGWAIAGGVDPEELVRTWLDPEAADLLHLRLGLTLFDPKPLRRAAQRMFERYRPRLEFACTLVEVPRLRPRLVKGPEMSWQHLAAACSIPVALPPVRVDGHLYVDGGLLGALPLWAAAEMGAEAAIAIDALPVLPSRVVRFVSRMAHRMGTPRAAPPSLQVKLLRPSVPLGTLRHAVYWNVKNARDWIELGERDAELSITM